MAKEMAVIFVFAALVLMSTVPQIVSEIEINNTGSINPVYFEPISSTLPSALDSGLPSPFDKVENISANFMFQVAVLHHMLCNKLCEQLYGPPNWNFKRQSPAQHCSKCFCDHLCHVYGDCCPDVQLLNNYTPESSSFPLTWEETKQLTLGRTVYTCEIRHLKPKEREADYLNYYSMVNYCPRNVTLNLSSQYEEANASGQGTSTPFTDTDSLEYQCENREGSVHWHYLRPWTSDDGVVYRNQFCAQCHGQDVNSLTPWATSVYCRDDVHRPAVYSITEAYFVAANITGCDILFESDNYQVQRHCTYIRPPIISTCNETGLWQNYDDKVARACVSFVSPVRRKYKNVFCYMCNTNMTYEELERDLHSPGDVNTARIGFFALLDVDEAVENSWLAPQSAEFYGIAENNTCDEGFVYDRIQCQCRPVKCSEGLRLKGSNCSHVFSHTNYLGYEICTRFHVLTAGPFYETDVLDRIFNMTSSQDRIKEVTAFPRLDCEDNQHATIDVHVKIYSVTTLTLEHAIKSFYSSVDSFVSMFSSDASTSVSSMVPAANCINETNWLASITDYCTTKNNTETLGSRTASFFRWNDPWLTFSPLYNTTLCPHVALTDVEFMNYTEAFYLVKPNWENVIADIESQDDELMYLVCLEDYLSIQNVTASCNSSGYFNSKSRFQDTWTIIGVMSNVSTCLSLVCLLAVIVTYATMSPLRSGSGQSTLAMTCILFLAQALHEFAIEQFEVHALCVLLALLIHLLWLWAVFMMTSCTLQLFLSMTCPLRARMFLSSNKVLLVSLLVSFGLSATIIALTILGNQLVYGDLGYPASYMCFIRRSLSRQLGFGLPLGSAVIVNVVLFLVTVLYVHRRPKLRTTGQDRVSLLACFRLSVVSGGCWLSLFLLTIPGTRPWLEYVFVVLLGLQGLLLATTLLLNKRVHRLWKEHFKHSKFYGSQKDQSSYRSSNTDGTKTDNSSRNIATDSSSVSEGSSISTIFIVGKDVIGQPAS